MDSDESPIEHVPTERTRLLRDGAQYTQAGTSKSQTTAPAVSETVKDGKDTPLPKLKMSAVDALMLQSRSIADTLPIL